MREITEYMEFNGKIGALIMSSDAPKVKCKEKDRIVDYLKSFEPDAVSAGRVYDSISNEYTDITNVSFCDNEFYWDSAVIYNFEKYDMKLNDEFVEKVLST